MVKDSMNYAAMVDGALRSVVRDVIARVQETSLPGNHHFYVSFRTDYADVVLSAHLRERYPEEMTIVLQHQFWGLEVKEQGFEVTLSFNDIHEYLFVPYAAMTAFADPSVQFGLQFKTLDESTIGLPVAMQPAQDEAPTTETKKPERDDVGADVVALDQFRKK
jgi:hypothetical protein